MLSLILQFFLECLFNLTADPCYNNQNLGDANGKSNYATLQFGPVFCDDLLPAIWYCFMRAAGTDCCFRADSLINWNIRDEMYVSNV